MKPLYKYLIIILVVSIGLFYCPKRAKADVFGIADSALLTQQIAQFFQDYSLGSATNMHLATMVAQIEQKAVGLQAILNTFGKLNRGVGTFSNMVEITRKLARTTERINGYVTFLGTVGDDFQITKCYYLYRSFESRTKLVLDDVQSTLSVINKLNSDGSSVLKTLNDAIESANSLIDSISDDCISELADEIKKVKMEEQAQKSTNMTNLVIV